MRKIIVLTFISLDGVMQAPGGPDEDRTGDFKFGGWTVPYFDEFAGKMMGEQMSKPFDLLLGKKTYDIFASYWPKQPEDGSVATKFNATNKYVVSHSPFDASWKGTIVLSGDDVVDQIKKLKNSEGPDLQVHGSGNFIQTLLKHDLVDELWLKIFPVILGPGKKLFADGVMPKAFKLLDTKVSPMGIIIANYKRDGEVKTGSFV